MKWISASASLPAGVGLFVAENLDFDVHDVPPRKWPDRGGPGLVFVAAMRSRVRDPSSVNRSGSTASAAACSVRRARDRRARRDGARSRYRARCQASSVPSTRTSRAEASARVASSEIGFAAMPDTSESGAGVERDRGRRVEPWGCGGDERVIEARLSSDRYLDAGRDLGGAYMVLSFRCCRMMLCRWVHAGHHVIADPRRPGRAVKPASPERGRSEAERLDGPEGRPTIRRRDGPAWCHARTPSAICAVSVPASRKLK